VEAPRGVYYALSTVPQIVGNGRQRRPARCGVARGQGGNDEHTPRTFVRVFVNAAFTLPCCRGPHAAYWQLGVCMLYVAVTRGRVTCAAL
jgi:hypothetical protein